MLSKSVSYKTIIDQTEKQFVETCDEKTFARERAFALQAFIKNPRLQMLLKNKTGQDSARHAVLNVATTGVTLNPIKQEAFLVPRGDQVCLDISYRGIMRAASESKSITWITADVVRKGESFERPVLNEMPIHGKNFFGTSKGEVIGAYCCVRLKDGDYQTLTIDMEDIQAIKAKAKGGMAWKEFPNEMYIKTAIKRARKQWLTTGDSKLAAAIECSNEADGFKEEFIGGEVVNHQEIQEKRSELLEQKENDYADDEPLEVPEDITTSGDPF